MTFEKNDTVNILRNGKIVEAIVREVHGPIVRIQFWDGKKFVTEAIMTREILGDEEESDASRMA